MKKTKQPGDNISLKTKKTEDPSVMQWINAQTNLMDSLRYLIENEVHQNGVRNLQAFIPTERNVLSTASSLPKDPITHVGVREIREGREEVAATARSAAQEKSGEPSLTRQTQLQTPSPVEASRARMQQDPIEDDIADEDIEAWV